VDGSNLLAIPHTLTTNFDMGGWMKEIKRAGRATVYTFQSIALAGLLLAAQISLAGSATWLFSPQDSAWENANNWTAGGPPNGPSDVATFAASFQTNMAISTTEEVNEIVFTNFVSFHISVSGSALTISGTGVTDNSGTVQTFVAADGGQILFNNISTAGDATI